MLYDVAGFATFVGVDLHKCTVTLEAVSAAGEAAGQLTISTKSVEKIERWLRACRSRCGWPWRPVRSWSGSSTATATASRGSTSPTPRNWPTAAASGGRTTPTTLSTSPSGWRAGNVPWVHRRSGTDATPQARPALAATQSAVGPQQACHEVDAQRRQPAGAEVRRRRRQRWLLAHGHLLKPVQRQAFADYLDVVLLIERHRERLRREMHFAARSEAFAQTQLLLETVPGIGDIWG